MVYKRKGRQYHWIKYSVNGEPCYESSKSPLAEDAKKHHRQPDRRRSREIGNTVAVV